MNRQQWFGVVLLGATGVALFNLLFHDRPRAGDRFARIADRGAESGGDVAGCRTVSAASRSPATRRLASCSRLFGVGVVLGHGDPRNVAAGTIGVGELALFGCVLAWATYTLVGKRILQGLSPIAATTYAALIGSAMLAVVAAGTGYLASGRRRLGAAGWRSPSSAVIGTALAFVWFYEGVRTLGPARAAVFINLVPVAAITLAVVLLGEPLEASMLVGGALVVTGIYLINRCSARGRLRRCRRRASDAAQRRTGSGARHAARLRAGKARAQCGALGSRRAFSAGRTARARRARRHGHGGARPLGRCRHGLRVAGRRARGDRRGRRRDVDHRQRAELRGLRPASMRSAATRRRNAT